ncbi:MAG: hypothetical protein EBY92_02865 [Actinobacteria bacterium]|nr:hypothetical protein [Actinomycetota bacterium]
MQLVRVKVSHKARRRVRNVLRSGQLASGPMVKQFEAALKTYIGSQNVMAVSNGTSALQVALRSSSHNIRAEAECCSHEARVGRRIG